MALVTKITKYTKFCIPAALKYQIQQKSYESVPNEPGGTSKASNFTIPTISGTNATKIRIPTASRHTCYQNHRPQKYGATDCDGESTRPCLLGAAPEISPHFLWKVSGLGVS
jgi:hypothetical protein